MPDANRLSPPALACPQSRGAQNHRPTPAYAKTSTDTTQVIVGDEEEGNAPRKLIVLPPETIKRGQILRPIDDDPAAMELYNKAWDRIKATSEK